MIEFTQTTNWPCGDFWETSFFTSKRSKNSLMEESIRPRAGDAAVVQTSHCRGRDGGEVMSRGKKEERRRRKERKRGEGGREAKRKKRKGERKGESEMRVGSWG